MNISFGRIGRISAVICFCFILVLSLWQCFVDPSNSLPLGLYEFFITAPILGVIELPFCFSCGVRCAAITKFISRVTGYWAVRAVIYIGLRCEAWSGVRGLLFVEPYIVRSSCCPAPLATPSMP